MTGNTSTTTPDDLLGEDYSTRYRVMLRAVANTPRLGTDTVGCMWPEHGTDYRPGNGFMVIGIATNGWEPGVRVATLSTDVGCHEQANNARALAVSADHRLAWVTDRRTTIGGRHYQIGTGSAFWRVTRQVLEQLCPDANRSQDAWCQRLAWTNLYKVAPSDGGNPRSALYQAQLEHCCQLLQLELTKLRPTRALVVADVGWWWPFAAHLNLTITPRTGTPVQALSRFADTNLVFAERPEGEPEKAYADAVVEAFHSLKQV